MTENLYIPSSGPMQRPESVEQAAEVLKEQTFPAPNTQKVKFHTREFTSVCPKTGQPDFGEVTIEYTPDGLCLESKSVKFYLWAFREHGAFTEQLASQIADDVQAAIDPREVTVTVLQWPRGGVGLQAVATRTKEG